MTSPDCAIKPKLIGPLDVCYRVSLEAVLLFCGGKLSTFGEYCALVFGNKVSFEEYSISVTY